MICIILVQFVLVLSAFGNSVLSQLSNINKRIEYIEQSHQIHQQLSFIKISYFEIEQHNHQASTLFQLYPSINIMQGESSSFPALLLIGEQLYSIKGNQIFKGKDNFTLGIEKDKRSFISTVRNQFTFFAEITLQENKQYRLVSVFKIMSNTKRIVKQTEFITQIPKSYGEITGFSTSFSLSLRLFAFTTNQGNILFYRSNGTLYSMKDVKSFQSPQNKTLNCSHHQSDEHKIETVQLIKLGNNLAIFSSKDKSQPFLFTINSNIYKQTIKWYQVPQKCEIPMTLKYDQNNWELFYLKCDNKVYQYLQKQTNSYLVHQNHRVFTPRHWYPLLTPSDEFYLAGNLLIVSSYGPQNEEIIFYYNITDGKSNKLKLPDYSCEHRSKIGITSHNNGKYILCRMCMNTVQCYNLNVFETKFDNDYSNYAKLKIPIIIAVLIAILVFSFIKSQNKNKTIHNSHSNQNQEKEFMKFLKNKDLKVYDQLVSSGIAHTEVNEKRNGVQKWNSKKILNKIE